VVAFKGARTGHYYAHHIRAEKVQRVKRLAVSAAGLVYIVGPDS
jgi:hypothetical protein